MPFMHKKSALISILPDSVRRRVLMTSHLYEPPPAAGARQQELAYTHLRVHVQKQCEILVQYEEATSSGKAKRFNWQSRMRLPIQRSMMVSGPKRSS